MLPAEPSSARREILLVLALTLVGAGLRLWSADRLGLSQFDEGVYAQSGLWVYASGGFARSCEAVQAFAPPGFTALIGLAYLIAMDPSDGAAIGVATVCGILTIPVVGWLGRRTFGSGAGAASAAFAAISGPHVVFSRMALTDAPFLLTWLIALGLGQRFLERPGVLRALAFGVAVGVAQNFKYSGWIAGVVVALAALTGLFTGRREALRALSLGMIAAVAAALVYLPWFLFVESHGGYARLLAHHRTYLGGWSSWWPQWRSQMAQAIALSGGPRWQVAAWALASLAALASRLRESKRRRFAQGLLIGLLVVTFFPNLSWWICFGGLPTFLADPRPSRRVLMSCWLVLAILTPFYHPYARLWLPIHAVGWLALGASVAALSRPLVIGELPRDSRLRAGLIASAVGGMFMTFWATPLARPLPELLGPSDGLRRLINSTVLPPFLIKRGMTLRTFARPVVYYYLSQGAILAPMQRPESAIPPAGTGDYGLIDEALIPDEASRLALRRRLVEAHADATGFELELPPATLLDIDPGYAFWGPTAGTRKIWFLRPTISP